MLICPLQEAGSLVVLSTFMMHFFFVRLCNIHQVQVAPSICELQLLICAHTKYLHNMLQKFLPAIAPVEFTVTGSA